MQSSSLLRQLQLRRGAITPLTILCLALLVGVTALVIDGGTLLEARRHAQAAADAAALAGADDFYANYLSNQGNDVSGTAAASAQVTASANGFDGTQSTVTVRTSLTLPPTYLGGPNTGQTIPPGYIEVTIQYNAPHLFSGVFGSGDSPIQARAVARGRCTSLTNNGVTALNLNSAGALNVSSTGGLTVHGCIQICSSSSSALAANTSGQVTATQFILNPAMVGSGGGGGGGGGLLGLILGLLGSVLSLLFGPGGSAANIVTSPPAPDPLRFLPPPNATTLVTQPYTNLNITRGTKDLYPGVYNGGIRISGSLLSPTTVTLHANSDGTPGIYYLNGQNGLQVSGFVTLTTASGETAGVMIYNNWSDSSDSIAINVGLFGGINLIPPSSGLYRGLCIFQKRGTPLPGGAGPPLTLKTNVLATATVSGTIYAPYASVSLASDLSNNNMCGQVIADTATVGGNANININPSGQPTANQRQLGLVE